MPSQKRTFFEALLPCVTLRSRLRVNIVFAISTRCISVCVLLNNFSKLKNIRLWWPLVENRTYENLSLIRKFKGATRDIMASLQSKILLLRTVMTLQKRTKDSSGPVFLFNKWYSHSHVARVTAHQENVASIPE
jgi:hypothetical protein